MSTKFSPIEPSDPAEIAGYTLRARLGSGGMGNVYLSFTRGGRPVALKVVRREFADDPEFRRRFRAEVIAAQRVQGLYTAPVVDADPDAPVPWLATAYIAGPSLGKAVAEYGPLPELSVYRLLAGVAEGLESVHAAGLVHRDLKPANVLLASDGPRVIDFGIAHAVDATSHTGTGAVIGTPAFMAPEQVAGRPVSAATDVFALGHLVLYAATGHTAFGDGHFSALVYRIAQEEPDLVGCPDSLRALVAACLAKDPAQRPDLAQILTFAKGALAGQTLQLADGAWLPAPLAGAFAAYDTSVASLPAPAAGPATITAGVGGAAAGATMLRGVPGPSGFGVERPRRGGLLRPGVLGPVALVAIIVVGGGIYLGTKSGGSAQPAASSPASVSSQAALKSPAGTVSASASAPGSASASASGAVAATGNTYSTPLPFPLCDPNGAQWNLVNLSPQSSNGCAQPMGVAVSTTDYGFGTTGKFPTGAPLTATNTLSLSGTVPGNAGYQNWCMGVVEGDSEAGYGAYLCNTGQWYVKALTGLGSNGVIIGKQLASGTFPFTANTSYTMALAAKPGTATLTISLTQGTGSPMVEAITVPQITPTAVGYSYWNENPTIPIGPVYPAMGGLVYTAGS